MSPWRHGLKRLFDLLVSGTGLLLFALPMAWMAWRIRRESSPPILFRQQRIGTSGKPFVILKFKTMSKDKGMTLFGQWMRATAMDELPQLINIFRGEMSFVGPRPLIPEELKELRQVSGGNHRQSVRPGLTGLAQLHTDKAPSLPERLKWDLGYVRDCSLWLDLRILATSVCISWQGRWEKAGPKTLSRRP